MNQKGVLPIVIAVAIIAILGALAYILFPWIANAMNEKCNSLEVEFGLDEAGKVSQSMCVEPNSQEIRGLLSAAGSDPNTIPSDLWSIVQLTCKKETSLFCLFAPCWGTPEAGVIKICDTGAECTEEGQNASCTGTIVSECNGNGVCDAGETIEKCPNECICNGNGTCEPGETMINCPGDCYSEK